MMLQALWARVLEVLLDQITAILKMLAQPKRSVLELISETVSKWSVKKRRDVSGSGFRLEAFRHSLGDMPQFFRQFSVSYQVGILKVYGLAGFEEATSLIVCIRVACNKNLCGRTLRYGSQKKSANCQTGFNPKWC